MEALNVGDSLTDTFTVATEDGTNQQVTVTINGADDNQVAVITGDITGTATEAGGVNNGIPGSDASGDLNHTDVDNSDDTWQAVTNPTLGDNSYGSYTIDAAGNWTYVIDNSNTTVEALNVGDSLTDTFTVATEDGSSQQVTVTIDGANDSALITGDSTGTATEAGGINNDIPGSDASGNLNHTDVDNSDDTWQAVTTPTLGDNSYGSYTIDAAGNWTYVIDNSNATVEALNVGDSLTDTFTVATEDGTSQQVTVTINGADDDADVALANSHIEFDTPKLRLTHRSKPRELEAELHLGTLDGKNSGNDTLLSQITDQKQRYKGILNQNRDYGFAIDENTLVNPPSNLADLIDYQGFKFQQGEGTPDEFSFDLESGAKVAFNADNEKVLISQEIVLQSRGFGLDFGIDRDGVGKREGFGRNEGSRHGGKDLNANEMLFFDVKDSLLGTTGVSFAVDARNNHRDREADVIIDFWSQDGSTFTKVETVIVEDLMEGQIYMGAADLGMSFDAVSFSSGDGERFRLTNLEINTIAPESLLM